MLETSARSPWFPTPVLSVNSHARVRAGRRPVVLFFLMSGYIFLLPVQFENASLNLAPSDLFLALALVLGLGRLRWVADAWGPFHVGLIFMFVLSACLSISDFGTLVPYARVKLAGLLALFASYLCLTSAAPDWNAVRSLARTFVLATTLNVVVALIAFAAGISVPGLNYGTARLSGMLLDPNAFGGLLVVALTLQLVTYEGGDGLVKGIFGIAVSAALALGLALTYSRSAWIGFAFALTLAAFFRWRLLLGWVVFAVVGAAGFWTITQSQDSSLKMIERANTAQERIDQIQQALPMFSASPVLGTGIGGFSQRMNDPVTGGAYIIHNTTVWIMTELGLLGLSVYLGFLLWFFVRGVSSLKISTPAERALILALMCAHAGMIGVSTGIEALYQRHWWFSMALLASCCVLVREKVARSIPVRMQQIR